DQTFQERDRAGNGLRELGLEVHPAGEHRRPDPMMIVAPILGRVGAKNLHDGRVDGALGVVYSLVVVSHLTRVERPDLLDPALQLPDSLLDLVGREMPNLGRRWRGLAA